jgi:2-oxoglutarate ferredoxin oxidoreductase subunit beta
VAAVATVGEDALLIHDAHREDPSLAFALSRLTELRAERRRSGSSARPRRLRPPRASRPDLREAQASFGVEGLTKLLHAADTWSVGA